MNSKEHDLFKRFPIEGEMNISIGKVPTPYHIYDGVALFIGGTADFDTVQGILKSEDVMPIKAEDDRAVMGIWVADFTSASLNPHHELQFSVFVSKTELSPLTRHPFNAVYAQSRQDIKMLCHGLWNNTREVVAYNRELLSLNAHLTKSDIQRTGNNIDFVFEDAATASPIISGSIQTTPSLSAAFSFMARVGFRNSLALMREPWSGMEIVNPKGVVLNENVVARAFAKGDTNVFRFFNSADELKIEHPLFKSLNFVPEVLHYMNGCKFVYLQPGQSAAEKQ